MRVREVGPDDWVVWRLLRQRSLLEDPQAFAASVERWTGDQDREDNWRARLAAPGACFVAEHGAAPVGMVAIRPNDDDDGQQLISMWVAPSARGRGVGRALVGRVIAERRRQAAVAPGARRQRDRHPAVPAMRVRARRQRSRRRRLPRDAPNPLGSAHGATLAVLAMVFSVVSVVLSGWFSIRAARIRHELEAERERRQAGAVGAQGRPGGLRAARPGGRRAAVAHLQHRRDRMGRHRQAVREPRRLRGDEHGVPVRPLLRLDRGAPPGGAGVQRRGRARRAVQRLIDSVLKTLRRSETARDSCSSPPSSGRSAS